MVTDRVVQSIKTLMALELEFIQCDWRVECTGYDIGVLVREAMETYDEYQAVLTNQR